MEIWPAIDLRGGNCVRLKQGDYNRETIFNQDPAAVARDFSAQGAKYLHLVDLDGAREGKPCNLDPVREILTTADILCELGGGIRSQETIEELLELGLHRLVLGTSALKRPDWFREICRAFPKKLVLGLDARDGKVATDGWLETSNITAIEIAQQFSEEPLAAIIYTDIATDGMMAGPNVEAMAEMQSQVRLPVVASGGVTTDDDIRALAKVKMGGAIIGRALYEETMSVASAIAAEAEIKN